MFRWVKSQETKTNKRVFYRNPNFIAKLSLLLQCFLIIALFALNLALKHHWASCPFIEHINTEEPVSRERYMVKGHVIPNGTCEIYPQNMMERLVSNDIPLHLKIAINPLVL